MIRIHPTADVSSRAEIGDHTAIWHQCQVREGARIGCECILGKNVYVDFDVSIGDRVKIQNNCSVYHGVIIEEGVFLGPHVVLTNDLYPRAINPDGTLKGNDDWEVAPIRICYGSSIGARSVVLPGVTIGRFAMVGAGAVVTRDVPAHGLVVDNPARLIGYVCACGCRLRPGTGVGLVCTGCNRTYDNPPA
ncbi:MAG: N-acetyltransferase [Chloroflexi bacterium HGW-Chloroflexi-1]|nr:MAG: N-acetyltransferase [Chloroflexi bacterium HGW-Chloroflexi-1]